MKYIALAALLVIVSFLAFGTTVMHPMGKHCSTPMDSYFIRNAQQETGSNNVVTSIVFDYRGYDTLGEATVLFTAVTGIAMLFGRRLKL